MVNKLPKINCCVSNLLNKNQFLIRVSVRGVEYLVFQSYSSEIAIYNTESQKLYINERYINYSKTTSKHLYYFINTYTRHTAHDLKELRSLIKEKSITTYNR